MAYHYIPQASQKFARKIPKRKNESLDSIGGGFQRMQPLAP